MEETGEISAEAVRLLVILTSWSIFILFFLLGKFMAPPGERRDTTPLTPVPDTWKREKPAFSWCSKSLIYIYGEAMAFPKFYALFFGVFPATIALASLLALEENLDKALFLSLTESETLQTEQVLLWEVVYCFMGCMFTVFLSRLHIIGDGWGKDILFEKIPFQYSEKLFDQFSITGSLLLLIAVVSILLKDETDLVEEVDVVRLVTVCVLVAVNLLLKFGLKGCIRISAPCGKLDGIPSGVKFLHVLSVLFVSFYILKLIGDLNNLAKQCFLFTFIGFVVFPNVLWILSFSVVGFPKGEENRITGSEIYGHQTKYKVSHAYFSLKAKQQRTGSKHCIISACFAPTSAYFLQAQTESEESARMYTENVSVMSYGQCQKMPVTCWPYSIGCCVLMFFAEFCHRCDIQLCLRPTLSMGIRCLSPPLGRSGFHLTTQYDACIFMVDSPGFSAALGYFDRFLGIANSGLLDQNVTFFFKCNSFLDYCILQHGLGIVLNQRETSFLEQGKLDFSIIMKGRGTTINYEESRTEKNLIESKCLEDITDFAELNLGGIHSPTPAKSTVLVSVGTSYTNNLARSMAAKHSKEMKFLDTVFEDSVYRIPFIEDLFAEDYAF